MFKSLVKLTEDVVDIATAPIEIGIDTVRGVTKPMAESAQEVVKEVKEMVDDNDNTT